MAVLSYDLTTLDAATHLGGSDGDRGEGIDVDAAGDAYVTGRTESNDAALVKFPITPGVFQPSAPPGTVPAFVAKISADATTLRYSTFLGGSVVAEPFDVTVDALGRAYVTGENSSDDFPLVAPLQPCTPSDGDDAFVSRLSADASSLQFSTCLSAAVGRALRLDAQARLLVTGRAFNPSLPVVNPLFGFGGGVSDAFVLRLRFNEVESYCACAQGAPCGNADASAGCANSTGAGASLAASGTTSVAGDDLVLTSSGMPAGVLGVLVMGSLQKAATPFGDGQLCIAGGATGIVRFPAQMTGPQGSFATGPIVGLVNGSFPAVAHIAAGDTRTFQAWYRDPQGPCGSAANLTNALAVTFAP